MTAVAETLIRRARATLAAVLNGGTERERLPIRGLPHRVGELASGEPALLLCAEAQSRHELVLALLERTLPHRRVAWLSTAAAAPARVPAELRLAALRGHLHVFTWTEDTVSQLRRHGAARLLAEFAACGVRAHDLLIVDILEPWLEHAAPDRALEAAIVEATHLLMQLSRHHRGPVVGLGPERFGGQAVLPLVAPSKLTRIAALQRRGAQSELHVFRWRHGGQATQRGTSFTLEHAPEAPGAKSAWRIHHSEPIDARAAFSAGDAATVHAMRSAVLDATAVPAHWHVHAGLESLMQAATGAVAATVVLAHDHHDALPALAEAVHRLRREHPHLLKIVVRETDARMRKNGELALLRLGANTIMGPELGFAFLIERVEALGHEIFARRTSSGPARTLQLLAPEPVHGYLPPLAFCALVERMLERTTGVRKDESGVSADLEHSLVYLPLLPNVAHVDALLACRPRRDGDLVSTDANGLYVFLFGCPHEEANAALDSLFTLPCSELAHRADIEPDTPSQMLALARLRRASELAPADYSTVLRGLAQTPQAEARPNLAPAALAVRGNESGRAVQAHALPLRAAST